MKKEDFMNRDLPYGFNNQMPYMFPGMDNMNNLENINNLQYKINALEERVKKIEDTLNMNMNNNSNNKYNVNGKNKNRY